MGHSCQELKTDTLHGGRIAEKPQDAERLLIAPHWLYTQTDPSQINFEPAHSSMLLLKFCYYQARCLWLSVCIVWDKRLWSCSIRIRKEAYSCKLPCSSWSWFWKISNIACLAGNRETDRQMESLTSWLLYCVFMVEMKALLRVNFSKPIQKLCCRRCGLHDGNHASWEWR